MVGSYRALKRILCPTGSQTEEAILEDTDEFEAYLAKRRRTGKVILVCTVVLLIASIAIPYALMKSGVIRSDTFDIFVFIDIFLGIGTFRAVMMRLKDAGKWTGWMPFS